MTYYLSHVDVRAIQTVLDECGELWSDAPAWQEHVARRAEELVGGHCSFFLLTEPEPIGTPLTAIDVHASTPASGLASNVIRSYAQVGPNPPRARFIRDLVNENGSCCVSFADLMPKDEFVSSTFFEKCMAPLGATDALNAVCGGRSTPLLQLSVCRPVGDRTFDDRERGVLAILADAIDSRVERQLSTSRQRGLHDLTPRQKQVLRLLLAGDSEKQVAYTLGVSVPAVHDHIENLHRYFNVHSRGELLAYFIHRRPATKTPTVQRMSQAKPRRFAD
jgi:DNA-binding CsgD family transcriptional regulator